METLRFTLLDIDYITRKGKPLVRLFGKLPNGKLIIAHDRKFNPYLYVESCDIEKCMEELRQLELPNIVRIRKKDSGVWKEFIKININHSRELSHLKDKLKSIKLVDDIREHDIPFHGRYLVDKGLFPMSEVEVRGKVLNHFHLEEVCKFELQDEPRDVKSDLPEFNILSFKIEAVNLQGNPQESEDPIIMVSFSSNKGFHQIFSTKNSTQDYVETVPDEEALLRKFAETVKVQNPDVIVGYNSDKFDFPYLKERAAKSGVKLNLGVDGSRVRFMTGRRKAAIIKGRVHVDLYKVVRRHLQLNSHTLHNIYLELFGEYKVDIPADEIYNCWNKGGEKLERFFQYSLEDVKAMSRICEMMLVLSIELSRLVGQPLFDVTRRGTGYLVEWYLIRMAQEYGEMVPNKFGNYLRDVVGGYVEEPAPGLHENIFYFDFRSLYPSIIIAKNISPDTLREDGNEKTCYIAPEFSYKFQKDPIGFIPRVTAQILKNRFKIKAMMKEATNPREHQILDIRQNALKTLVSTIYGLFNHSTYRWYSIECSEAITAWGREFLKKTTEEAEKKDFKVVYADTDGFYAVPDE